MNIKSISFVIPIYNEAGNIEPLFEELRNVSEKLKIPAEFIFVNDGSKDESLNQLRKIHQKDQRVKVVDFRRNFGQTAAMSAGFHQAKGDVIVTLDGDMQNDPADIPRLLRKMSDKYDLVSGWRQNRKEAMTTRKLPSMLANKLIGKMTGTKIHDYGCTLKAYRSEIAKDLHLYGEMHRFIPALCAWQGAKITEIPVNDRARVMCTDIWRFLPQMFRLRLCVLKCQKI